MCDCKNNLQETAIQFTTETNGITYQVFQCSICGKYFIKRFGLILGVTRAADGKWIQTEEKIQVKKYGLTDTGKQLLQDAADGSLSHSYEWFVFENYNQPDEKLTSNMTLPDAVRFYNASHNENKRLGVTKDEIATVDFVIKVDGNQKFTDDYTKLASFSTDKVISEAFDAIKQEVH